MTQTLVLEAATWIFVPGEMLLRAWTAPKRLVSALLRHLAAVRWAGAGEIHVNRVPLSTQVSQPALFILCVHYVRAARCYHWNDGKKTLLCNVHNYNNCFKSVCWKMSFNISAFLKKDLFFLEAIALACQMTSPQAGELQTFRNFPNWLSTAHKHNATSVLLHM